MPTDASLDGLIAAHARRDAAAPAVDDGRVALSYGELLARADGIAEALGREGVRIAELRAALVPLLELPVEHVLASHWSPVIGGGHAALERALA